ncbi:hypothetical protein BGZ61DRAFT_457121, partial [Ilyonectria robusta]|uniref:uncharacterized protein n=1 Tax=Ilyonectria robusta TaxID=1079257 RepID=UPI001E8CEE38
MNTTLKQGEIGLKRFDGNTLEHKPTDYLQATEDKLYADMNLEDSIERKQAISRRRRRLPTIGCI